jgi:hypothetical protein
MLRGAELIRLAILAAGLLPAISAAGTTTVRTYTS